MSKTLPPLARLDELAISSEVAQYMLDRGIELPSSPPKIHTPNPGLTPGAEFHPERVDRVLKAFSLLRHTQGKWAGQPLTPDAWQVAYILAPVFGWCKRDTLGNLVRIIRYLYVDVPRKNGKTTLCGGLAIYMMAADLEPGAQVYAAAVKRDQADKLFQPVKMLAERSPALKGHLQTRQGKILHPASGSYFKVEANDPGGLHGANVHAAVIDELHVHKSPDLLEALETGIGSRTQPLVIIITTADSGKTGTVYDNRRNYIEQLARGGISDASSYGVVWGATEEDDPFIEATWIKANPGYGVSPSKDFMEGAAARAKNSPVDLASFLRLHLGLRTKQETRYIDLADWDANTGDPVNESSLQGRTCYGGLDLASVSDLNALCLLFPDEDGGHDVLWRFWTPEDNLRELDKRTAGAATSWVRNGWLRLTPGNVTDYDYIEADLRKDREAFDIREVGFDRWNSSHLVTNLMKEDFPFTPIGQGFATMSSATKEFQRLVLLGNSGTPRLRHGGNPAARWQVDNLAVEQNPAGDVKPTKAHAHDKIDGVVALIMALYLATLNAGDGDYYNDHDLLIL